MRTSLVQAFGVERVHQPFGRGCFGAGLSCSAWLCACRRDEEGRGAAPWEGTGTAFVPVGALAASQG